MSVLVFKKTKLDLIIFVLIYLSISIVLIIEHDTTDSRIFHRNRCLQKNVQQQNKHPHILFIMADDLGFNDIGYHGSNIKTPNLDRLAMSGVRLENYYVQATCTPTRAALLTGRYSIHTGVQRAYLPDQPIGMPLTYTTLADKLREAGYATHIVGKWHLGFHKREYIPTYRGFDSFFGFYNGFSDHFTHITKHHHQTGYDLTENETPVNISMYDGYYSTDLFTDKAIKIIQNHNLKKPLFVYLPFQGVHAPIQAPDLYVGKNGQQDPNIRDKYEGMVTCIDDAVERIVQAMKKRGLWDNTILVYTSDNGGPNKTGASNWPLRGFKGDGWEGGVRAVGFVHSKLLNSTVTGTVSKELIHITDWFPTFVKLAGGNLSNTKPLDGVDIWKTIRDGVPSRREEILHDVLPRDEPGKPFTHVNLSISILRRAGIRIGNWKLMKGFSEERSAFDQLKEAVNTFLYNIEKDPIEDEELSADHPNIVSQMLKRLQYYHRNTVPSPNPVADVRADPRLRGGFWKPWKY